MVVEDIMFIIPRNSYTCPQGHLAQWIKSLVRSILGHTQKSVSSISDEDGGRLSEINWR